MKLKSITIIYTILLLILLGIGIKTYATRPNSSSYLPEDHKNITEIQEKYALGIPVDALENNYGCDILLYIDSRYEAQFWEAIEKGSVLYDLNADGVPVGKIIYHRRDAGFEAERTRLWHWVLGISLTLAALGYLLLFLLYLSVTRPFHKLEKFAGAVAKGNLDLPLPMDRGHFFGSFTESFDLMREELKLAREREYQANQSKKELVAELSHDIKTPVATIKANCELGLATTKEASSVEKFNVIETKASTIEKLVDNLFHATLDELQVLKVEPVETDSSVILKMLEEMKYYGNIHPEGLLPACLVWMDELRFSQVLDNIVYNSYKYAQTDICVSFRDETNGIIIRISDSGEGVPEDELALITQKFFRGSNTRGKTGSGLGLFLANTFMEQMKGGMNYYNNNGFVVELFLRRV